MSRSILIVDDSPSIRQMVGFTLRSAGFNVVDAEDGMAALELAKTQSFDLVVTDINMPHMDGFALTSALRAMDGYSKTPILVLTTESCDEIKQKGRASGATGWLIKPFNPLRLTELVRQVIG